MGSVCLALSRNLDKSSSPGSPITPRLVTWWKLGYARGSPQQGDKSAIWQVIRRLAPKTAKTRVPLRGPKGELLTQQEETDRFVAYCQKVYHAPPEPVPLPTDLALVSPRPLPDSSAQFDPGAAPASGSRPPPVRSTSDAEASSPLSRSVSAAYPPSDSPLGETELQLALTTLPARKATPQHLAQLLLWQLGKGMAAACPQTSSCPDLNWGPINFCASHWISGVGETSSDSGHVFHWHTWSNESNGCGLCR